MHIYIYIYIYIYGLAAGRLPGHPEGRLQDLDNTLSFHKFKSQNFKLSVSNPKNKYVAYVSVLSQISNCQGLGRKSFLKTDRII